MKMNKLYKNILLLLIVLAPGYWLTMTVDGQRRTDALLLHVFGQKAIDVNLLDLDNQFSREQWMQVYTELSWHCTDEHSAFGESSCIARIGSFNEIPSSYLVVYFVSDKVNAVKINYRDIYHQELIAQLKKWLGKPSGEVTRYEENQTGEQVLRWKVKGGIVILKEQLESNDEPALIWLSSIAHS